MVTHKKFKDEIFKKRRRQYGNDDYFKRSYNNDDHKPRFPVLLVSEDRGPRLIQGKIILKSLKFTNPHIGQC